VTQPSQAEYGVIIEELNGVERQLAQLRLFKQYEDAPSPTGNHRNLLSFFNRGDKTRLEGTQLANAIAANETRLQIIQDALADWNAREEAFRAAEAEAVPVAADPPKV
jgi:hypothetical protein